MDIGVGQVPRAAALAIIIMSASPAAAQDACQATPEHSIVVCFDATPLTIEHCFKTLQPHFAIDVWQPPDTAPVAYRYSYQVIAAGKGVPDPPQTVGDDDDPRRFPFIGRKRVDTFRTPLAFQGNGEYELRVGVMIEGQAPPPGQQESYVETSPSISLAYQPNVLGLAIGIGHYTNSDLNLNYPEADATLFHDAVNTLLKGKAVVQIELRTSATEEGKAKLTKDAIRTTLEAVERGPEVCGPDDWYVFYYSGHGVLGVTKQLRAERFLSTIALDPDDPVATALTLRELFQKLQDTGAQNILVVLDSCFAGSFVSSNGAGPTEGRGIRSPVPPHVSGKVKFIYDNRFQSVAPSTSQDDDAGVLATAADTWEKLKRHAWLLAAAGGDQEAEEGPVSYQPSASGSRKLSFTRGSTSDNAGLPGHGLFTYVLLANVQKWLPEGSELILPDAPPPASHSTDCSLDFKVLGTKTEAEILDLAHDKQWTLQDPEVHASTTLPQALACAVRMLKRDQP